MSHTTGAAPPDTAKAPKLTGEEMEAILLHLVGGNYNNVAALLARPEKVQAARERFARARRNEAFRQQEAPINRAAEAARRGS